MGKLSRKVDAFVGEKIRERRTELGMTQQNLAAALDISYQQVQKYETGANRVSAGRLYEIARRLDMDVGEFFGGFRDEDVPTPMGHGGRNRTSIDVVRHFAGIADPQIRTAIAGLVRALSDEAEDPGNVSRYGT